MFGFGGSSFNGRKCCFADSAALARTFIGCVSHFLPWHLGSELCLGNPSFVLRRQQRSLSCPSRPRFFREFRFREFKFVLCRREFPSQFCHLGFGGIPEFACREFGGRRLPLLGFRILQPRGVLGEPLDCVLELLLSGR